MTLSFIDLNNQIYKSPKYPETFLCRLLVSLPFRYTDSIALTIYRFASVRVPPSFALLLLGSITAMILTG